VTTDDGDLVFGSLGGLADYGRDKGGSSDNVEVSDTEQPEVSCCPIPGKGSSLLGVKDTSLLEGLGKDGDGRVDGVGDDEDESLGASVGNSLGKGSTDTSVDLLSVSQASLDLVSISLSAVISFVPILRDGPAYEEIISGHTRLPGDTSGDDDNVGIFQSPLGTIVSGQETSDLGRRGDVGQVRSDLHVSGNKGRV
jgi:hypothetical protein